MGPDVGERNAVIIAVGWDIQIDLLNRLGDNGENVTRYTHFGRQTNENVDKWTND